METPLSSAPAADLRIEARPATTRESAVRSSAGLIAENAATGLIVAVVSVASALSNAALLFSGDLSDGFAAGACSALLTALVTGLLVSLLGGIRTAIAGPDSTSTAALAALAAGLAPGLAGFPSPAERLVHVLVAVSLATVLTGLLLLTLGRARVGSAIRYIPYPIIGGVLAATGWLMATGAIRVMTDRSVTISDLPVLLEPAVLPHFVAGSAFATAIAVVIARVKHFLALPVLLLLTLVSTHVVFAALSIPIQDAGATGWLFPAPSEAAFTFPFAPEHLASIRWESLVPGVGGFVGVMLVTSVSILLNATGIEVATGKDTDLDRELGAQGIANVASGVAGGFIGFVSLGRTLLALRAGATTRVAGVTCALACGTVLFVGRPLIGFVPRFVLGGLLLYLGGSLFREWAVRSRKRLSAVDYALVILILVVTVASGFINAVFLGLVAACLIFAFNYSRIRFIKHEFNRREFKSTVERSTEEDVTLVHHGERIRILVLQGYLFFGSANRLHLKVKEILAEKSFTPPCFLVFDFGFVSGLDSSAALVFLKIAAAAEESGARIVLSGVPRSIERVFDGQGVAQRRVVVPVRFPDLDRAMEWCEAETLRTCGAAVASAAELREWLLAEIGDPRVAERIAFRVRSRRYPAGAWICRQGEPADVLFFVERGRVSILLERTGHDSLRLRSLGGRTVLGEVGFYLRETRSASILSEDESVVHELDRGTFEAMSRDEPDVTAALSAMIVRLLAQRLVFANGMIGALKR